MVDGMFIPQGAAVIKKIPLSRTVTDDTLFWSLSQDGDYTCKLGTCF